MTFSETTLIPFKKTVSDVSVMRFIWLPVVVYPWLVAASYISKQTSDKTRKYSSKENFMRKLLKLPGEEEILGVGAAVSKEDRKTVLVVESATSNYITSPPSKSPSMVAGGRVGVRLPSMAMLSLVSRIDSLCRNYLVTSSSSLPRKMPR